MTYPVICLVCYVAVSLVRRTAVKNEWLPLISCALGAALALVAALAFPQYMPESELIASVIGGALSGLAATGGNQVVKQAAKLICERHGIDPKAVAPIVDATERILEGDSADTAQ